MHCKHSINSFCHSPKLIHRGAGQVTEAFCESCPYPNVGQTQARPQLLGQIASPSRIKPCIHKGPKIDERECESCGGKVRLKVFRCEIHQACTVAKPLGELACCLGCRDYE